MNENWKDKIGTNVIFTGKLVMLDEGTVGILKSVYDDWCVVIYPQNASYEDNGKGGWKPVKNATNKIYAHSCLLSEIMSVSDIY